MRQQIAGVLGYLCLIAGGMLTIVTGIEAVSGEFFIQNGEKLTYRISWSNFIEAGTAELTAALSGAETATSYRLQLKVMTSPSISKIYPFRDDFVSYFDSALGAPSRFEKNFIEKTRVVKETVEFDQSGRRAVREDSKKQRQRFPIDLGTQDPLSALYVIRGLGVRPGLQASFAVQDGGRIYQLELRATGNDLISTGAGSFSTQRITIFLSRDGVRLNDRRITLWMTSDNRRLPVLAAVDLPFGSALIELTSKTP
jgi:hypothetical protein